MPAGGVIGIPCNESSPRSHILATNSSKFFPVSVPYTFPAPLIGKLQVFCDAKVGFFFVSPEQQMASDISQAADRC